LNSNFFYLFKEANQSICIGQWVFEALKPFFVKPMQEHNTCCYIYHVKIDELWIGLNNMQKKFQVWSHPLENCVAYSIFYKGITSLWETIVCPKGELMECHKRDCMFGECPDYGIKNLFFVQLNLLVHSRIW
jgi:hypothetical protein